MVQNKSVVDMACQDASQCQAKDLNSLKDDMEPQKDIFVLQWNKRFPGAKIPQLKFSDHNEVERHVNACQKLISVLEDKLQQKKFYLCFLQTYLAIKKNDCFRESDNASNCIFSSVEVKKPDADVCLTDKENVSEMIINKKENGQLASEASTILRNKDEVVMQNGNSTKRRSRVLENVKIFEAFGEVPTEANRENEIKRKPSTNGRSTGNYVEVWECSTGSFNNETELKSVAETNTSQIGNRKPFMMNSKRKSSRSSVHCYEEVWACNTGEKVIFDVKDNIATPAMTQSMSIEEYIGELESEKDLFIPDRQEKKINEKKPCKLKVQSRKQKPCFGRRKYPPAAYIPSFQDSEITESQSTDINDFSNGGSDVDDDNSTDSHHSSEEADNVEFPLYKVPSKKPSSMPSPILRLKRALTTNERMSVAFSFCNPEWSDEDALSSQRSPLFSSSVDFPFEEESSVETDTSSNKSSGYTYADGNVVRRIKDREIDELTAKENRKSTTSFDSGLSVGSPQGVSHMVDYQKVRNIADAEKLTMRMTVLNSLLDTEAIYLKYLEALLLYMKPLKATIATSQPVMSIQDFETVFYRVPEIHKLHEDFYETLKPRLDTRSADTTVGDLFKNLLSQLKLYGEYLNNYKKAQQTVEKCAKENEQFALLIKSLKVKSRDDTNDLESISLVELLYKPVERLMRTTLVLRDLLKRTPHRHPDFPVLREVLKESQLFLDRLNSHSTSAFRPKKAVSSVLAAARVGRELIKQGFLVEITNDGRKLRHCFLFNDLLLCAKPKNTAGVFHNKTAYECKWYIPLADLSFQAREDSEVTPDFHPTSEDELRDLSNQALKLKADISREQNRNLKEVKSGDALPSRSRKEERLMKKLAEVEARMVLVSPDLPLKIYHMEGKSYLFLMSSDYERTEWTDAILKQQESSFKSFTLPSFEINLLLSTCAKQRKLNNIQSMWTREDEELLSGYLTVNVKTGHGFLTTCNPYCTLEVDSYGQFQTKARTKVCHNTKTPGWNEEFELEVDGANTLRILCYDRAKDAPTGSFDDDVLIAKGKLKLFKKSLWAKGEWIDECVWVNDLRICLKVKFSARENVQRLPSRKPNGVFGVNIEKTALRSSDGIPDVIKLCVTEIEKRGIDEVGIYRVSGVASEIKSLKDAFDSNRKDVNLLLSDVDIHAIAGVLKLYFRELPEPLFTDSKYQNFIDASSLADPETKQRTIKRLLSDLPIVNYKTLRYLRQHLINVANMESVNKMTFHNLATVFGPTLLRPAEDKSASEDQSMAQTVMMLNVLRLDVHSQMDILMYCLQLDDLPEYDILKRSLSRDDSTPPTFTQRQSELSTQHEEEEEADFIPTFSRKRISSSTTPLITTTKQFSPSPTSMNPTPSTPKPTSPTPIAQPRYHPYEEIVMVTPQKNTKQQPSPCPSNRKAHSRFFKNPSTPTNKENSLPGGYKFRS